MVDEARVDDRERREKIRVLEALAESIKANLQSSRRPLFVEFAGLPKSGKTTAVNSLALFLRRNDIPVKVVAERASVCPIRQKVHMFFNTWTGCMSLVSILEALQVREHRVVVMDRGIFDTLIWMTLLRKLGKMTDAEHKVITEFFLLHCWRGLIDLVIYMTTTVESALRREFKDLLTEKPGSIMNPSTLNLYLEAADEVRENYGMLFRKSLTVNTTNQAPILAVEHITKAVLTALVELSDEELVLIPLSSLARSRLVGFVPASTVDLAAFDAQITMPGARKRRSEAERDEQRAQLVVCAVITYKDESVLVSTRREPPQANQRLHGMRAVWAGGHLRWGDLEEVGVSDRLGLEAGLRRCLLRELQEELGLREPLKATFEGLVYDTTHRRSILHLGFVFRVRVDDPAVMMGLHRQEFAEYGGQGLSTEFVPLGEVGKLEGLEAWSIDILGGLFRIRVGRPKAEQQLFPL